MVVDGEAARIVPGSPVNSEGKDGAQDGQEGSLIPGPMVACVVSGDESVIEFCAKTLNALNESKSNGVSVVATADSQNTAIEIM